MLSEVMEEDLDDLLDLYTHLHNNPMPEMDERVQTIWQNILSDSHHHIIVYKQDGRIVSSVVLLIVPNLTHSQRPYGVIENVITHPDYRQKGYASECLNYARDIAKGADCYKLMLLTGSKEDSTLHFYEQAGYNRKDKTAFIQWL